MPETAYLYDAVHLYERSLLRALDENRDPRNGKEMVATLYGVHYRSAMGYVASRDRIEGKPKRAGPYRRVLRHANQLRPERQDEISRREEPAARSIYFRRCNYGLCTVTASAETETRRFVVPVSSRESSATL